MQGGCPSFWPILLHPLHSTATVNFGTENLSFHGISLMNIITLHQEDGMKTEVTRKALNLMFYSARFDTPDGKTRRSRPVKVTSVA
jgi:hypothetical protein